MSFISKLITRATQVSKKEYWPREKLERYQARSLQRLRRSAYANSPFYQKFHKGLMDRPLQELPTLSKADLMEHFDEVITDRAVRFEDMERYIETDAAGKLFQDRYFLTATSGTTGHRTLFLSTESEWLTDLSSMSRQGLWYGLKQLRRKRRIAYALSTVPFYSSSRLLDFIDKNLTAILILDAAHPLDKIVRQLNEFQPEILTSYGSLARVLAKEQLAGRLNIQPEVIATGGDGLTADTRQLVEKAWGKLPFNGYASTETGGIAAECNFHTGLHMFEDMLIIENVDKKGKPVPPGEYGERLLVTVLFRRLIPLIRYQVEDLILISDKPCPCGRTFRLIEDIGGRICEVVWLPRETGGHVSFHPNFFIGILDPLPVSEWQVIHKDHDRLDVKITNPRSDFRDEMIQDALTLKFKAGGGVPPQINVVRVPDIPRGRTGKAVLVLSEVPV